MQRAPCMRSSSVGQDAEDLVVVADPLGRIALGVADPVELHERPRVRLIEYALASLTLPAS